MAKRRDDSRAASPAATRPARWGETHSLLVVVFVCGAVLMAFEIVGSRILAPTFGSTVFVWGSLIGVFLGALSAGYFIGGRTADRFPSFFLLGTIIAAAGLIVLLVPLYAPAACDWIDRAAPGRSINPFLASMVLFFIPSVLIGTVSPFAVRLQTRSVSTVGHVAGRLYSLSTLGSIAGTLFATFWMIPSYGASTLTKGLGITLMVVSLLAILPRLRTQLAAGRLSGALTGGAGILLAVALSMIPAPSFIPLSEREYLIDEADSAYQHIGIVLLRSDFNSGSPQWSVRMMFDKYIESEVIVEPCEPDDSGAMPVQIIKRGTASDSPWASPQKDNEDAAPVPEHIRIRSPYTSGAKYTDMLHLPFIFNPDPRRCLIVGGGGGVVPTIFHKHYPGMVMDVVEIDPLVVDFAATYFGFESEGPRTNTAITDGRVFVRDTKHEYDLIILDAFTGGRPPFHLMTREFLELVKERLTTEGVVHLNIISALDGERGTFYRAVLKTFNTVFGPDHVYVFPKRYDPDYGYTGSDTEGTNVELVATNFETVPHPLSADEVTRRARRLVQSRRVPIASLPIHASNYRPEQRQRDLSGEPILTDDYAPVDMMVID